MKKRNVEIFLHGTILDNEDEEAADLYIYRLAEYKALQIGRVNRVLKEVSVDCILNSEQLNFTEDKLNQIVLQVLSNKKHINFRIGDKPYSAQCDYMERCIYRCNPDAEIDDINTLTYSEKFIETNTDKIIYRIKQLMKEKFYYEIDMLIREINIIKVYPDAQIYAALDSLVNNKNEFIIDKYGRLGHLINIDDLYLFQPIELTDNNISLYERSTPIPFKNVINYHCVFKIKKTIEAVETKKEIEILLVSDAGKEILEKMEQEYDIANSTQYAIRGEDNWYIFCSIIFNDPSEIFKRMNISKDILDEFVIGHMVQLLLFDQLFKIINYLYNKNLTDFQKKIKEYFISKEIIKNETTGLLLTRDGKLQLIVKNKTLWVLARAEDENDLQEIIQTRISQDDLSYVIGFITNVNTKYMIYKSKLFYNPIQKTYNTRNKGARCDQAGKKENS